MTTSPKNLVLFLIFLCFSLISSSNAQTVEAKIPSDPVKIESGLIAHPEFILDNTRAPKK